MIQKNIWKFYFFDNFFFFKDLKIMKTTKYGCSFILNAKKYKNKLTPLMFFTQTKNNNGNSRDYPNFYYRSERVKKSNNIFPI